MTENAAVRDSLTLFPPCLQRRGCHDEHRVLDGEKSEGRRWELNANAGTADTFCLGKRTGNVRTRSSWLRAAAAWQTASRQADDRNSRCSDGRGEASQANANTKLSLANSINAWLSYGRQRGLLIMCGNNIPQWCWQFQHLSRLDDDDKSQSPAFSSVQPYHRTRWLRSPATLQRGDMTNRVRAWIFQ